MKRRADAKVDLPKRTPGGSVSGDYYTALKTRDAALIERTRLDIDQQPGREKKKHTVYLDEELSRQLRDESVEQGRTLSSEIALAVEFWIKLKRGEDR